MQIDFHYCVIRVLAEKAGFSAIDAQTIATASQLVDDATSHKPIRLPNYINCMHIRSKGKYFDPVCTAHKGIQMLKDFSKSIQMKIYMCFHFLPSEKYTNQDNYDYTTKPDSNFANELLKIVETNFIENPQNRDFNLIKLGIALHTYADTWAHQGFSGRHNFENNAEKLKIWTTKWKNLSRFKKLRIKLLPEIGHAEAFSYPDYPFIKWQYQKNENEVIVRNNPDIFIEAAEKIYRFLCKLSPQTPKPFSAISSKLYKCFKSEVKSSILRFLIYKLYFPEVNFYYYSKQWTLELLNPLHNVNLLTLQKETHDYKWLLFHKAAFEQREFVISNIKPI